MNFNIIILKIDKMFNIFYKYFIFEIYSMWQIKKIIFSGWDKIKSLLLFIAKKKKLKIKYEIYTQIFTYF